MTMSNTHKITLSSHLTALQSVLFFMVLAIICIVLLLFFDDDETYFMERALGIACVVLFFPSLYLHFCYYLENKNFVITGLSDSLEIEDHKRNRKWVLSNDTILSIDVYAAAGLIDWESSGGTMLHLEYHYAAIKTKDGELILTSLLYPYLMDIKLKFREIKVNYHKTIFASI